MSTSAEKKRIRKEMATSRDSIPPGEIEEMSRAVHARLSAFPHYKKAATVMFFVAFRGEVRTLPLIESALAAGKRVVVPATVVETKELIPCEIRDVSNDLVPGAYGILQPAPECRLPVPVEDIRFVCVPGLAFDRRGNRIGYGGGYYDRFIRKLKPGAMLAALAFSFQVIERVPSLPEDRRVRYIFTEKEKINCSKAAPAMPL